MYVLYVKCDFGTCCSLKCCCWWWLW